MTDVLHTTVSPSTSGNWLRGHALLGSLIVHSVLIGVLALVVIPGDDSPPTLRINTAFSTAADEQIVPLQTDFPKALEPAPQATTQRQTASIPLATRTELTDVVPRTEQSPIGGLMSSIPSAALTEVVGASAPFRGTSETGTGGNGEGSGGGHFFGLPPIGDSVVFVVDSSRSMNHPYPPPARTRFKRVQLELVNTIGRMRPEQKFFIVFFNHEAIPMPANQLVAATPTSQQQYLRWMIGMKADGKTNPVHAMLIALQLRPETIYLLTDGDLPPKVASVIREANGQRVQINTIGFGDNAGEKVLQDIAQQNNGTYRFIPEDEAMKSAP